MINKKHLEKAILLSLLLTNVCRLGGATEYNSPDQNHGDLRASGTVYDGMITGASSDDSTFSSIKTTDDGKVIYSFADGDSVNNTTASWVAPTHSNFENLKPAIRTASDSDVVINAGDSLSMSGTTMGYGVVMVGADGAGELTFNGGKITIDNKYVEREGYAGGSVIQLKDGKITFNNTETELGCDGNASENGILLSGGTEIVFSEQAEKLTITAVNGIVIEDKVGGSFAFNGAAGEVTINASETGISFEKGGDVVFKGTRTVINAGEAAVEFYKNSSGSSADIKENVTFGAAETVLNGRNGLYVSSFNDSADKSVVFEGTAVINAKNADGSSSAVGMLNMADNETDITFKGNAELTADGATTAEGIKLGSSTNVGKVSNDSLVAEQDLKVSAVAGTGASQGILLATGAAVQVNGSSEISAASTNGSAIGVRTYNQGGSVELGLASLADTDVETFANITAASTNSWSAGVYLDDTSSLKIGGNAIVTAKAANDDAWGLNIVGGSESVFADDTAIGVETGGIGYGVYAATDSTITFGESPLTRAVGEENVTQVTVQSAGGKAYGIYSNDGSVKTGGQLIVDTKSNGYGAYGIYGANTGSVSVSEQAFIAAASENANAYGVYTTKEGTVDFDGDTTIIVSGDSGADRAVTTQLGGEVNFNKGVRIVSEDYSLYATTNSAGGKQSAININQNGGSDVFITGDVIAADNAAINMRLDTAGSYFAGVATAVSGGSGNNGIVNLHLANQARWDMAGSSSVSDVQNTGGSVIDMSAATGYQKLTTGTFSGNGGVLIMDTDLDSGESDKLIITDNSSTGGTQKILVKDLYNGAKQNTPVLLVSDAAGTLKFEAQDAYNGGLYNYKADVASKAEGGAVNWYLEGLQQEKSADTVALLQTVDAVYAGWILNNDDLHSRLGELKDGAGQGLWARVNGGKIKGNGFKNNYQTYQLGYDAAFADGDGDLSDKWLGGAAIEYISGNTGYAAGSGENNMLIGALYATRHSSDGSNFDIVLKHGQIKGDSTTHGINSDEADYKTLATSLSLEYGKRFAQKRGVFVEPQLQLTLGHIGSDSYTTKNGTGVYTDALDSAVGRLGVAVGREFDRGNVYFKASALHEFGGSGGVTMLAANGESLREEKNYSGTWCELALGGNMQLAKNNNLYFDVTRSFGGDFQKQWQVNAGVRFEF